MNIKTEQVNSLLDDGNKDIVVWGESYATGIEQIDNQHKELVRLTNVLYHACLAGNETLETVFKNAMSQMVEYVRFQFTAELEILKRINYPNYHEHKKQHDTLVMNILEASKEFGVGKKFVAHSFVRTLKDWVFSHIAFSDKLYATYVSEQKSKGLLTDQQILGE